MEELIIKKDTEITETKKSNLSSEEKILSLEKAAEVNEEYKIDLESKIKEMAETEARLKNQLSSLKNNLTEENAKRIQTHFQLKKSSSRQIKKKKNL